MSIIRDHNRNITFECDDCGETFATSIDGAFDAYQLAKAEGWLAVKAGAC